MDMNVNSQKNAVALGLDRGTGSPPAMSQWTLDTRRKALCCQGSSLPMSFIRKDPQPANLFPLCILEGKLPIPYLLVPSPIQDKAHPQIPL